MAAGLRIFADRTAAGIELARAVVEQSLREPVLVLGLPRGGVPVAYEVARALRAPLDVMVVRKIGMPGQPEFAIGAVASGDILVRGSDPNFRWSNDDPIFKRLVQRERAELARRERAYRAGLPPLKLSQHTVLLVDDGLATGSTMLAAIRAARSAGAAAVIVAVPVASAEAAALIRAEADEAIFVQIPAQLVAIGEWYQRFDQLEDAEVVHLLARARAETAGLREPAATKY